MTGAAPTAHDEQFGEVRLYERLSHLVPPVRHGPSNTTWVHAFRGTWGKQGVILFRPGDWLNERALQWEGPRGEAILLDLHGLAVATGCTDEYHWAMIDAPPGVRLRALSLRASERISEQMALAVAAATPASESTGQRGDTFIGWDGTLWRAPMFAKSKEWEFPSVIGDEIYDSLAVHGAEELSELMRGVLGRPISAAPQAIGQAVEPPRASSTLREIFKLGLRGEAFAARCRDALTAPLTELLQELGTLARETFPESHARQTSNQPGASAAPKSATSRVTSR